MKATDAVLRYVKWNGGVGYNRLNLLSKGRACYRIVVNVITSNVVLIDTTTSTDALSFLLDAIVVVSALPSGTRDMALNKTPIE